MVGLAGLVVGIMFRDVPGLSLFAAILISLAVGLVMGAVNGSLIAWARVPPVIVTLGGLSAYRGLTFIISGGSQIDGNHIPTPLIRWSQIGPFGIWSVPWVIFIAAGVALLTHLFLQYTTTGRNIYAIGNNPEAARLRGVPIKPVTFFVYAFTGAVCGLAGLLYASRFGFLNPGQTGVGLELTVIAAVVIGGVNVYGGSGSVLGVLLGCLLLGSINVALSVLGVAGTWQLAVYGLIILLAVTVDSLLQRQLQRAAGE
jgi:rhamnose transport system permease protein